MCGRFTLRSPDRIKFGRPQYSDQLPLFALSPRYNIAPTQDVLVITERQNERVLSLMRWGIIPSWSREPKGFINARAETLELKPSFSESFQRRRCLLPADGFYEWKRKSKQPYYFQMLDERPFAFAGIWDVWRQDGVSITSCSIITTTANELLSGIHDRMPVILSAEAMKPWLNTTANTGDLMKFLAPFPAEAMKSFSVSPQVNHAQVDEPQLVDPVDLNQRQPGMLF
jgi:putative SOS response-associated peptidase YedK